MNQTLGNRIAEARRAKGMTQEELAEHFGVSAQAVSKWENDVSCPDISLLPALARQLGLTLDELLTGKEAPPVTLPPVEARKPIDQLLLRILVHSADGTVVKINLPLPLIKAAIEMGMSLPQVGDSLKGIDVTQLLCMVDAGVVGKLVEVESGDGDTVEVFVE
jgi:transcriptional regulator with XRE-family HTH domain